MSKLTKTQAVAIFGILVTVIYAAGYGVYKMDSSQPGETAVPSLEPSITPSLVPIKTPTRIATPLPTSTIIELPPAAYWGLGIGALKGSINVRDCGPLIGEPRVKDLRAVRPVVDCKVVSTLYVSSTPGMVIWQFLVDALGNIWGIVNGEDGAYVVAFCYNKSSLINFYPETSYSQFMSKDKLPNPVNGCEVPLK